MTLVDVVHGRSLFQSPMDEPLFYRRYFRKWVSAAIAEKGAEGDIYDKIMTKAQEGKV